MLLYMVSLAVIFDRLTKNFVNTEHQINVWINFIWHLVILFNFVDENKKKL